MVARIGSIIAPLLAGLSPVWIPLVVMGGASLIGGILAIFLPETLGMPLPESIEDIEVLYENEKPWYKWIKRAELRKKTEVASHEMELHHHHSHDSDGQLKVPKQLNHNFIVPDITVHPATPYVPRKAAEDVVNPSSDISPPLQTKASDSTDGVSKAAEDKVNEPLENIPISTNDNQNETVPAIVIETPIGIVNPKKLPMDRQVSTDSKASSLGHIPEEDEDEDEEGQDSRRQLSDITETSTPSRSPNIVPKAPSKKFSQIGPAPKDSPLAKHIGSFVAIPVEAQLPDSKLEVEADDKSRRFSKIAPAPKDSPLAKTIGNFTTIPTEAHLSKAKLDAKADEEKSRRFSKIAPAPKDSPLAKRIGSFVTIPTETQVVSETNLEVKSNDRSRRFSKLPPAPIDSQHAVKMGSKFTMIPTEVEPVEPS